MLCIGFWSLEVVRSKSSDSSVEARGDGNVVRIGTKPVTDCGDSKV
jgi:hypothetical protein